MKLNSRRQLPTPSRQELDLLDAATAGDVSRVKHLLQLGVHPDARENREIPYNATPLMYAAQKGHIDIVELLLKAGADVFATDTAIPGEGGKNTCLHYAADSANPDLVRRLIRAGADVNARSSDGSTPLSEAARKGNFEVINALLEAGAELDLFKRSNWPPLLQAAANGHKRVVEVLLQRGADPNAPDAIGMTPLMKAAASSWPDSAEIVRLLLRGRANVASMDRDGQTALCWAVLGANPETVRILLQAGASVDFRFRDDQTTLLELAEKRRDEGSCDPEEGASYRQKYREIVSLLRGAQKR